MCMLFRLKPRNLGFLGASPRNLGFWSHPAVLKANRCSYNYTRTCAQTNPNAQTMTEKNSSDIGHLHSIITCFNSQSTAINVSKYTRINTQMHMHTKRHTKTNSQLGEGQRFSTTQMLVFHDVSTMQILVLCADLEKISKWSPSALSCN